MAEPDLNAVLAASAGRWPDRVAILTPDGTGTTFAGLAEQVEHCASALAARLGAEPAVVAVTSVLDPLFAIGYLGAQRAGHLACPLNPLLRPAGLRHALAASGAVAALVPAAVRELLEPLRAELPELRLVLPLEELSGLLAERRPAPAAHTDPARPASIQLTSGTTGPPKAVVLTAANLAVNAAQVAAAHRLGADAVCANHLPTYHPMHLNSGLAAGATQLLCPDPDPAGAVRLAARHGTTHYYSLPVRLIRLAADPQLPQLALPAARVLLSGGSALPPAVARQLAAHFGVPVVQGYGLAETSPLTHSDRPEDPLPGSVGRPVADTDCRVVDPETRAVLDPGEAGEVQLRGPQVMAGYLDPAEPSPVDLAGWLSTGDLGRIDGTGRLHLVDRIKDVFKHDNWLVSPAQIELVLQRHPAVAECAVVDLPDERSGAVAHAVVVPRTGAGVSPAELAGFVNEQLPYYEHLHGVRLVGAVPRSPNGKVDRRRLRSQLLAAGPARGGAMVTLVNRFTVTGDAGEFERAFAPHAEYMRRQPGFVRYQLIRQLGEPGVYLNLGEWSDADSYRRVAGSEEFRTHARAMSALVQVEGGMYELVAEGGPLG